MQLKTTFFSLLLVGMGLSFTAVQAQNKNVSKAESSLKAGKLDEAKEAIEEAVINEKTADKAKTWFVKGEVYAAIAADSTGKYKGLSDQPRLEAFDAYKKCLAIDPKFTSMLLTNFKPVNDLYVDFYRDGANAFNSKDYKNAMEDFKQVKAINDYLYSLNLDMGSKIDTMAILNIGNAAYNLGEKDTAAVYYQQLADIKYSEQSFIYKVLLAQYREKDDSKFMATLDEAKSLFPDDKDFANEEVSYYSEKGDMDKLVKKLEEQVSADPDNYNAILNLAITYDNMSNPKDSADIVTPEQHDEFFNKALTYYKKAIEMKPDAYAPPFNLGLMYYNAAAAIGKQLGQLTSSKEDQAKQDSLIAKQNGLLDQSLPHLEKAYKILDGKSNLDPNEMVAYKNAIIGLQGVYARQNKMDQYNELKEKLDAADSKAQQ